MGTMIEFAIVLYIRQRYEDGFGNSSFKMGRLSTKKWAKTKTPTKASQVSDDEIGEKGKPTEIEDANIADLSREASVLTKKIDHASIVLFTLLYIIFNFIYSIY